MLLDSPPKEYYSKLTELRDYTGFSLTYVNFQLYIFLFYSLVLYNLPLLINIKYNIKKELLKRFNLIDTNLQICERANNLLLNRFASFCIQISCSKRKLVREYSSLSMSKSV